MNSKRELINVIKTYENILKLRHEHFQQFKRSLTREDKDYYKKEITELTTNMKHCRKLIIKHMDIIGIEMDKVIYNNIIYLVVDKQLIRIPLDSVEKLYG